MYRTALQASAAADAAVKSAVVFGIIDELMHETLSETLLLRKSRLTRRHFRKFGVHTAVPAAVAYHAVVSLEIAYIVALARRADEGTRSAAEARLRKLLPFGTVEKLIGFSRAEAVRRQVPKRQSVKYLLYIFFFFFYFGFVCSG